MVNFVDIIDEPIDHNSSEIVELKSSGAINIFLGTVRDNTKGKAVVKLEYEAYDSMAKKEIQKIIDQANSKWKLNGAVVVHRKGILKPGDTAVLIAVSTPHRAESFEACRYIIDTLKETVPIWKKEFFTDGEVWVSAHP